MPLIVKVPLSQLGLAVAVDGAGLASGVAIELATKARALVRDAKLDAEVSVGKVISNSQQAECGVFLQHGLRVGAVATVRAVSFAPELEVKVGPLAKLEHWLVWLSLGASLVLGLVAASTLLPTTMAPGLKFALGLLGGVAFGVAAITAITRLGVGRDTVGSDKLAVALEALVRQWSSEVSAERAP